MIHRTENPFEGNLNIPREKQINKMLLYSRDLQRCLQAIIPAGQELNLCVRSNGGYEFEITEEDFPVAGGFAPNQRELANCMVMSLTSFDPE
jgi:hypothetical protein